MESFILLDLVGGDRDENGCIGSAGYTWCEYKEKCLKSWEESCEPESDTISIFSFTFQHFPFFFSKNK